jgi:hypothetical protein
VLLAAPSTVVWAQLTLAGAYERPELTTRDFDVACSRGGVELKRVRVRGNRDARPRVELGCAAVDRVRIEFPPSAPPLDRARLYEVELWGIGG